MLCATYISPHFPSWVVLNSNTVKFPSKHINNSFILKSFNGIFIMKIVWFRGIQYINSSSRLLGQWAYIRYHFSKFKIVKNVRIHPCALKRDNKVSFTLINSNASILISLSFPNFLESKQFIFYNLFLRYFEILQIKGVRLVLNCGRMSTSLQGKNWACKG